MLKVHRSITSVDRLLVAVCPFTRLFVCQMIKWPNYRFQFSRVPSVFRKWMYQFYVPGNAVLFDKLWKPPEDMPLRRHSNQFHHILAELGDQNPKQIGARKKVSKKQINGLVSDVFDALIFSISSIMIGDQLLPSWPRVARLSSKEFDSTRFCLRSI